MNTIQIKGELTPATLTAFANAIDNIDPSKPVRIEIDSEGGAVDVGFELAAGISQLQKYGVECIAVGTGLVYSSAVLPFLACDTRMLTVSGSILIHRPTITAYDDSVGLQELKEQAEALTDYAVEMERYYRERGVSESAISYLWNQHDELVVENQEDALAFGLTTRELEPTIGERIANAIIGTRKAKPNFNYILNVKQIKNQDMTKEEVQNEVREMLGDFKNEIVKCIAEQLDKLPKGAISNETTAMPSEELGKLKLYKTPVSVEGKPEIVAAAHVTEDLDDDRTIIPLDKDGNPVALAEGDYEVKHGDDIAKIHSTGKTVYLVTEEKPEPENEGDKGEEKPEPENEGDKGEEGAGESQAPKVHNKKLTAGAKEAAMRLHNAFARYGSGAVGSKK